MSIVAAGAKRNTVRDGASAHPTGSSVDSEIGVDTRNGFTNGMENSTSFDPNKGRGETMKHKQLAYESSSVRDRGYPPKKVLLRTPQGEAVIDLTGETIAGRSYEVSVGQFKHATKYLRIMVAQKSVRTMVVRRDFV